VLRYGVVEGRRASVACSLHRGELEEVERLMRFGFWKMKRVSWAGNWSSQETIGGMDVDGIRS
jgi:hypothetical protein